MGRVTTKVSYREWLSVYVLIISRRELSQKISFISKPSPGVHAMGAVDMPKECVDKQPITESVDKQPITNRHVTVLAKKIFDVDLTIMIIYLIHGI